MSTTGLKRWGLLTIQALVLLVLLCAGAVAIIKPAFGMVMLTEARNGIIAGMCYGFVKVISAIRSSARVTQPVVNWWGFSSKVISHETRSGFLGGWMFGLLHGAWELFLG